MRWFKLCDLIVYRKEGKLISEKAEFIKTGEVCFAETQRMKEGKGDFIILITTVDSEYVYFPRNTNSFFDLISELDGFVKIDRGAIANLSHEITYDKDYGRLTFKNIKFKSPNYIVIAKSYENRLLAALKAEGKLYIKK